ncbi:MAG: hypothetical protein R3F13_07775 [Prosthecobacter sp.]
MRSILKKCGGRIAWLCLVFVVVQCGPKRRAEWSLLSPEFEAAWQPAGMAEEGKTAVSDGEITLHPGQPMTGVRFDAWDSAGLPLTRYAVEYDAMRVEGNDFFGAFTFPVNDTYATLIIGGWGGTLVGISSIDDMDASENNTRGNSFFENKRWYKVRLEVREEDLRAWIDGRLFVNVSIKGRKVGLRAGEISKCLPFGFTTYATEARIRRVVVRRL